LAFAAFISDDERKTLLTRRSRKKSLWGGCWDAAVVSHVLPGETVEAAAKRRGGEELGIEVNFKRIGSFYYFAKHKENSENEYCYVLIGKTNDEVYPNPVEIMDLKKINLKELLSDIKKNPHSYTPWLKIAIRKINISRF
jgi:isopentenyl-diphosphate delta-isomerase